MCPRPLPGDAGAKPPADDRSEPGESAENAAARATNLRVAYAFTLLAGVEKNLTFVSRAPLADVARFREGLSLRSLRDTYD